jgi:hypothetical protein
MLRGIAGCTASAGRRSCTPSISRNEPRHADRERHALLALPAQRCDLAHVRLSGYRGLRTRGSWHLAIQTKKMEYSGCGSSRATMARPMAMIVATMPSMRSVLLSLAA